MKFIKSIFKKKPKYKTFLENTTDNPTALGEDFWGLFRSVVTNFYTRLYSCEKFKSDFMPEEYSGKDITRLDYFSKLMGTVPINY